MPTSTIKRNQILLSADPDINKAKAQQMIPKIEIFMGPVNIPTFKQAFETYLLGLSVL